MEERGERRPSPMRSLGRALDVLAVLEQSRKPLRLSEIARPRGGRQNKRDAPIIYEAVVEKMEWFTDESGILVIGQGIRGTHNSSRIERRVISERLGDDTKMFSFRTVERHVSARHQSVKRPW